MTRTAMTSDAKQKHSKQKERSERESAFDRELKDLPQELRWRERMGRIEAEVATGWMFRTRTQFAKAIKAAADLGGQTFAFTEMEIGVLCAIAYPRRI
jgi:chromosome segregation and condensation protein ScpB